MLTVSRTMIAVVIGALSTGCTTHVARRSNGDLVTSGVSESTVVGSLELARTGQGLTVLAALERVRPWFLSARGGTPSVSVDGLPSTDVSLLATILVSDVYEVRLVRATAGAGRIAVLPNGDVRSGGDVITVLTRRGARSVGSLIP
jgi:hypothetical protein